MEGQFRTAPQMFQRIARGSTGLQPREVHARPWCRRHAPALGGRARRPRSEAHRKTSGIRILTASHRP